ncbi:MAG: tetratricopeptide repeat protein [Bacteroidales bacterium]|nr:tetratricopeptide repeat protein [Bacteroidales bacterium]MDT8374785.1 tetratricopeptide repeat protein [Bacteroidales bacterium]
MIVEPLTTGMASIIGDFSYDIFISYRQKDNKYDGWITDFVDNLKKELEATFKEEISVYFDINPHDGLLETHDVDESLKEKLRCLIFIPIVSRTYCDPKSFAWQHEFVAFVEQASKDRYGLKVKLPSGNVASRVLPVYIHDLNPADQKLFEEVLGGMLRGVEFIYKAPGVNRPLRSAEENPHDNLNHTIYRDQVNKVANAIDEIFRGLTESDQQSEEIPPGEFIKQKREKDSISQPGKPERGIVSLFKDLKSRAVPQLLAAYLVAGLIIVEIVSWLAKKYLLSPHLVSFCMVALAAMIPAVIILAYFHGKQGRKRWTKAEKIGIPSNLVAAVLLLVLLFHGRNLGATTTTVSFVDEQGKEVDRLVPKSEFRKKLLVFSMENNSGDNDLDWLAHAMPDMLSYDLSQDIYLNIRSVYDISDNLREEGYPDAISVPMTLKKKIASEKHMDYFTAGQIKGQDGLLSAEIYIHDTRTTKLLAENTFTGRDIFTMVDNMTIWIKEALGIPEAHIENTVDLPVAEITTMSVPALKNLYHGLDEYMLKENREIGLTFIRQAIEADTTFAYAYRNLYAFSIQATKLEEAMRALISLMTYIHKLPENDRFDVKHDYYFHIKQDPEMSMEVARNWAELYPEDIKAHEVLAMRYMMLNQKENELAEYEAILTLDPGQYDYLLTIGDIHKNQGRFDEALKYYQRYADVFPGQSKSFTRLGSLYSRYGDNGQATKYYNKALLIDPDDISIQLSLAGIRIELGKFGEALNDLNDILEKCTNHQERYAVYNTMEDFFFLRGEFERGIEKMELKIAEQEKYDDPINVLSSRIDATESYAKAGKTERALNIIADIEKQLMPPFDYLVPFGYLIIYIQMEDIKNIEKYLPIVEEYISERELWMYQVFLFFYRAKLSELKGRYDIALQQYEKAGELEPGNKSIDYYIGHCYRILKDYKRAERHLLDLLSVHPYWPEELSELGFIYADRGKEDKAIEYLQKALFVWENADPGYKPAVIAREKLAELESAIK